MKKLLVALAFVPFAVACNQDIKDENARLKAENLELTNQNGEKDSILNDFAESFTRVQDNLAAIREKEESIQAAQDGGLEKSTDAREVIMTDIEAINELILDNRQTIENLNDKVNRYSYEVGKFKKMVSSLNLQIAQKDTQIVMLKEDLAGKNFEIGKLNTRLEDVSSENKRQKKRIDDQETELNTAYYAAGTYKELKENKVVTKEGGLIGIGRTKTLAEDFNKEYFTRVDISKTSTIPVDAKKVKLLTSHPSGSYKLIEGTDKVTGIQITDAEKFWKSSKYLVIILD